MKEESIASYVRAFKKPREVIIIKRDQTNLKLNVTRESRCNKSTKCMNEGAYWFLDMAMQNMQFM